MGGGRLGRRLRKPRASIAISVLVALVSLTTISGVAAAAGSATVARATTSRSNLVVFVDRTVQGAFVAPDGSVGPNFQISARYPWNSPPSTATDGTDHLVAWEQTVPTVECHHSAGAIYGAIVRGDRTVSEPFSIATWDGVCDVVGYFPSSDSLYSPRVGFDGTNYFVVWNTFRSAAGASIDGARVTPDGVVLDPGGETLVLAPESGYYARPRLAFDGTNFLVTYYRAAGELCDWNRGLFAARVNTLAAPIALDPQGIPISVGTGCGSVGADMDYGGVAFDGTTWVVVWTQSVYRSGTPIPSGLIAARVSSAGVVLDPLGVTVATASGYDRDGPAVVFDDTHQRLLVVWGGRYNPDAKAMIIKSTITSGIEVVTPPFNVPLENPDAALSVDQFLIIGNRGDWPYDIRGMRVSLTGELLDAQPFPISTPDTTPPETAITSSPSLVSNSATAMFEFDANERAWFECRIDSQPFSSCSSPMTYPSLAEGGHTFEVFARDLAENVDATPAKWTWTIDTTPPETSIAAGPSGTTNSNTASFSFTSSEIGSSFECRLDAAVFSGCSSPSSYAGLSDGSHVFEVRAIDKAGNVDGTSASRGWTVDATSPGVPSLTSPASGNSTNNSKPTFDWSDVADPSGVKYQIQVDNSGGGFPSPEINQSGLSDSSFTPGTSLAVGTYSWRVRATDGAGNIGAWSAVSTVTITTPPGSIAGKVTNQATKKGIAGATVDCGTAGVATTASDGTYSITSVAPGSYTCTASASGYKALSKSITVSSNSTATANFALKKA